MVAIKPKTIVDLKLAGVAESHARTRVSSRDLVGVIDEPLARGGTNQGFTPTETLLASLVGCTNVITSRIAHAMDVTIRDMEIAADARFDRRGVTLEEEIAVPFPEVTLTITLKTSASAAQLADIKRDLSRFCPIAKVIRGTGTKLNEVWNVSPL